MTDITAERTIDTIQAEIKATTDARKTATGATKGMYTRKLKQLTDELTEAEGNELVDELGEPIGRNVEQEQEQALPQIHDSDLIDGTRYSIDVNGDVWAPDGDQRLGAVIGNITRDDAGMWHGRSNHVEAPDTASGRTRRLVLTEIVRTHVALAPAPKGLKEALHELLAA
jgi:hypothetical protein